MGGQACPRRVASTLWLFESFSCFPPTRTVSPRQQQPEQPAEKGSPGTIPAFARPDSYEMMRPSWILS
jgi:hypothetical protein